MPSKLQKLKRRKSVKTFSDFKYLARTLRDRVNLVAEGDSWFAYPPKGLIAGPATNVIDYVQRWAAPKANLLRLASNGDEATAMLSGKQRHLMTELLDYCTGIHRPVDAILFSAGGNDVVGRWDVARFLRPYQAGRSAAWHLRDDEAVSPLDVKVAQIELVYVELCHLCAEYSPSTKVVTHTYDEIHPSDVGFKLFGSIPIGKSWLRHYMEKKKGIHDRPLQKEIADLLLGRLHASLIALESDPRTAGRLRVVDTHGILPDPHWWQNEIHPTAKGFEKIAKPIYRALRQEVAGLPAI